MTNKIPESNSSDTPADISKPQPQEKEYQGRKVSHLKEENSVRKLPSSNLRRQPIKEATRRERIPVQIRETPQTKVAASSILDKFHEMDWTKVEISEDSSNEYITEVSDMVTTKKDIQSMLSKDEVPLANGKTLTKGEHAAVDYYSKHGFSLINQTLRNEKAALERAYKENDISENEIPKAELEILKHCEVLCSAMNKLPPTKEEEITRGALLTESELSGYSVAFKEKTILTETQVLSTSTSVQAAKEFVMSKQERIEDRFKKEYVAAINEKRALPVKPKNVPVIFSIAHKNGKSVEDISEAKGEKEVLFIPGTKWQIANIIPKRQLPQDLKMTVDYVILLKEV